MAIAPGDDHRAVLTGAFPCDGVTVRGLADFSPCRTWRWRVEYSWDDANPARVIWLLLNPSTADGGAFDPTLRRCFGFTRASRRPMGGMVVFNAYGLRATSPKHLKIHPDPVGPGNLPAIAQALRDLPDAPIVCGFGGHGNAVPGHVERLRAVLSCARDRIFALGFTDKGFPKHPLYLRGVPSGASFQDVLHPY